MTPRGSLVRDRALDAPLPPTWIEVALSDLGAQLRQGFSSGRHNTVGAGVLHVRPMNVSPLGEVDLEVSRYLRDPTDDRRLEQGDIVLNNTNSPQWVGKTALWDREPAAFSNHMTRVRLPDTVERAFIAKQLHLLCLRGYFRHHSRKHVNQASVSLAFVRDSVPLRIPPRDMQRRIMARLETLETYRLRVLAALGRVEERREPLRAAVFDEAFAAIADAPAHRLGELVVEPLHYGIVQPGDEVPDGIPVVRSGDLTGETALRADGLKRVSPEIEGRHVRTRLRGGEVLISVRGTVGPVAMATEALAGANVTRGVAVIRPQPGVDSQYLAYYLDSPAAQAEIATQVRGVAQQSITLRDLAEIRIPVPSIQVQNELSERLAVQIARLDTTTAEVRAARTRIEAIHRELLEKAFSGELIRDDGSASFESAAELVRRTRAAAESTLAATPPKSKPRRRGPLRSREPSDDTSELIGSLRRADRPLTPAELLDASVLPDDDVDRFYRALVVALREGSIQEQRPDRLTVVLVSS